MKTDHKWMKSILCSAMASLIFISAAHATGNPPHLVIQSMGAVMSRGIVIDPLREKVYQAKISNSTVINNSADSRNTAGNNPFTNDMKGEGLTAALTYGFNNHCGTSILAGYTSISGTRTLSLMDDNGAPLIVTPPQGMSGIGNVNGTEGRGEGIVTTVNAIWDYREEGDQFRFPLYLGAGVMWVSEEADATVYGVKRTADFTSPTILVGMAPTFVTENFSTAFFFMIVGALNPGNGTINDYRHNTKTQFPLVGGMDSAIAIAGIELTYRPWGLGFSYAPDVDGEGAKSIGFKWSTEWGGKK